MGLLCIFRSLYIATFEAFYLIFLAHLLSTFCLSHRICIVSFHSPLARGLMFAFVFEVLFKAESIRVRLLDTDYRIVSPSNIPVVDFLQIVKTLLGIAIELAEHHHIMWTFVVVNNARFRTSTAGSMRIDFVILT